MKTIQQLISHIESHVISTSGDTKRSIEHISHDSRDIRQNSLFVAIEGATVNGLEYTESAIENGAVCILSESIVENQKDDIAYVVVDSLHNVLGNLGSFFYDNPTEHMKIIGVTGTNGKTTIATTLYNIFTQLGHACGLISTIENKIGQEVLPTKNTTPDALTLQELFYKMKQKKCEYVFMEVSSHALALERVQGVFFQGAIYTNLSHDHLSFHGDFESYAKEKKKLFDSLSSNSYAIINTDDDTSSFMAQDTNAKIVSYSLSEISDTQYFPSSSKFIYKDISYDISRAGAFNIYNILACIKVCEEEGVNVDILVDILKDISSVPGRFEILEKEGIIGIVDYAHTPDALENVLKTIQEMKIKGKIITVCGAGGDRDPSKRPLMAAIAEKYSDIVIFTNDNPRTEDPEIILQDIIEGVKDKNKYEVIPRRREAIERAKDIAESGDVILIAGKGHEKYQDTNGIKTHFDDVEEFLR